MLWKTLYSLFRELPNEQEMYQSIASVGNMLLKLGEFGGELETSGEKTADQKTESVAMDRFMDPLHVAELESSTSNSVNLVVEPNEVTVTSELGCPQLVKEALMDAARSSESSLSSPVRSSNGEDFVLVGSDDGFSTPEQVPSNEESTLDTLGEVYNKLTLGNTVSHPGSVSKATDASDIRSTHSTDLNSRSPVGKQGDQSKGNLTTQSHDKRSSGTFGMDQSVEGPSSGTLGVDQSIDEPLESGERPASGMLDLDWSICFEQFLASMLTEPYLVHYFEETVDVVQRLKKMKTEGMGSFRNASKTSLHLAE